MTPKQDYSLTDKRKMRAWQITYVKDIISTIEHYGGDVFYDKQMVEHETELDK